MVKILMFFLSFGLIANPLVQTCNAKESKRNAAFKSVKINTLIALTDTVPPVGVMKIIKAVINSTNNFNVESVADLYTPNAVVTDDEPPYSWNGPTAGVQWVDAVEQACKNNRLTKLKGTIEPINVYLQTIDNVYIIVPVSYTGNLPHGQFDARGAFNFVLRLINGKWMIKSQAWLPQKGM